MADDARRNLVEEVATLLGHAVSVLEKESVIVKFDLLFRASEFGLRGPTFEAFKKLDPDAAVEALKVFVARAGETPAADQIDSGDTINDFTWNVGAGGAGKLDRDRPVPDSAVFDCACDGKRVLRY